MQCAREFNFDPQNVDDFKIYMYLLSLRCQQHNSEMYVSF